MEQEEGGRLQKRPLTVDLNVVIPEIVSQSNELYEGETSSQQPTNETGSSSGKRAKKVLDPNIPPNKFVVEARAIATAFYSKRSFGALGRDYINHNEEGFHKLTQDLRREIETKFEEKEEFNNFVDYWLHPEWLDRQVTALTRNIVVSWCYHIKKKPSGEDWDQNEAEMGSKLRTIQSFCQQYSSSRKRCLNKWKETVENEIGAHCVSGTFRWLEGSVRVVPMPDQKATGAYGSVRKVMLTRLKNIPSWILFAGKTLNTTNEREKRHAMINEAGGCPVKHPGIIRLAYLHPRTMEGYTLWWNGGSLINFLHKYNSKVSESVEVNAIEHIRDSELTKEELEWVATYRRNRMNLALSLLVIVGRCHEANYIHNDISTSNVLLHFDLWNPNRVYIGLCDWGLSSRVVEKEPSRYAYQKVQEMQAVKARRRFAAPELFYLFGAPNSSTSLEMMQASHLYSAAADAYSAGYIAAQIWNEEWDSKYFKKENLELYEYFRFKLARLQEQDPQKRASIPDTLDSLKKSPYNWTMPDTCFRYSEK